MKGATDSIASDGCVLTDLRISCWHWYYSCLWYREGVAVEDSMRIVDGCREWLFQKDSHVGGGYGVVAVDSGAEDDDRFCPLWDSHGLTAEGPDSSSTALQWGGQA